MDMLETKVHQTISTDSAAKGFSVKNWFASCKPGEGVKGMESIGFSADASAIKRAIETDSAFKAAVDSFAADAGLALGDYNIDALGMFFYFWNEQTINRLYMGRSAAQLFPVKTMGNWLTERIIYKTRELVRGGAGLYDDFSRPSFPSYNRGYETRDTVRIEWGVNTTYKEEMVAAAMRFNAGADKNEAMLLSSDIWLNWFFWKGLALGDRKLYGSLNEPNASDRKSSLLFDMTSSGIKPSEVIAELLRLKQNLITDLLGNGDVNSLDVTWACPISWQTAFTAVETNTINGYTANTWLKDNWSNLKVSFHPELETLGAGGTGVSILFAKSVPGVGMDTMNLSVTSKLHLIGAEQHLKGRTEAYSASCAGAFCACPIGIRFYENGEESSSS